MPTTTNPFIAPAALPRFRGYMLTFAFANGSTITARVYNVADGQITVTRYVGPSRTAERVTFPVDSIDRAARPDVFR